MHLKRRLQMFGYLVRLQRQIIFANDVPDDNQVRPANSSSITHNIDLFTHFIVRETLKLHL